jgi:putative transposase
MKTSQITGEQIAFARHQAEMDTSVAELCRKVGKSETIYHGWMQHDGGLGPSE